MKLFYNTPEIRVISLEQQDVITASDGATENTLSFKELVGDGWLSGWGN